MALDRRGIATMAKDFLKADTSILYGDDKLIQLIENKTALFSKAKVSNTYPNAIYIWVDESGATDERMQNTDYDYILNFRFESLHVNPETSSNTVDDALERINKIFLDEMYNGTNLSSYYTDSNGQIINISVGTSTFSYPETGRDNVFTIEIESAIIITVNKWA